MRNCTTKQASPRFLSEVLVKTGGYVGQGHKEHEDGEGVESFGPSR
jgi:hypothetical protein